MRKIAAFVIPLSIIVSQSQAAPYCLALRGNGEAEPAHWGALARVVETEGLPKAQSGGSSAAISLMFLDSIASNPWVVSGSDVEKKSRAAFLLKMLHGVTIHFGKKIKNKLDKSGLDLQKVFTATASREQKDFLNELLKNPMLQTVTSRQALPRVIELLNDLGIDETSHYFFLLQKFVDMTNQIMPTNEERAKIQFYGEELQRTLATFGSFDAESDPSIFFRQGIVNFEKLGFSLGKVATYLSGKSASRTSKIAFERMISLCEPLHIEKTWKELIAAKPKCQEYLEASLGAYFKQKINWDEVNFALNPAGTKIVSIPTTAVLMDSAFAQAQTALALYHSKLDRSIAENFKIQDTSKVRFGYWGNPLALDQISRQLPKDEKSKRFLALGETNWLEVLRTSPAEPGLANFQPLTVNGKKAFSAGGWSDLHPVLVLNALGCNNVIYVTRQGGESLFAQGIAKRLLNFDRSWEFLNTKDEESKEKNKILNDKGDPQDQDSLWSRLYNLGNRESSFKKSLAQADAILCTDWNRYDVKTQLDQLVEDSYRTPLVKSVDKPGCF